MKKVILLASGLLCSSLVFASDPAAIDSLINLQGVVISANKVQDRGEQRIGIVAGTFPTCPRIVCDAKGNYRFWSFGRSGRYG